MQQVSPLYGKKFCRDRRVHEPLRIVSAGGLWQWLHFPQNLATSQDASCPYSTTYQNAKDGTLNLRQSGRSESLRSDGTEIDPHCHTSSVLFSPLLYGGQIENPSWTEERSEGYEPDCPSVYAQSNKSNGVYSATQEVTGP
jgi:hypothetical protein